MTKRGRPLVPLIVRVRSEKTGRWNQVRVKDKCPRCGRVVEIMRRPTTTERVWGVHQTLKKHAQHKPVVVWRRVKQCELSYQPWDGGR